jgi:prepilin-type N-terminal cleavage/methylation domain-containing protein
MKPINTPQKFKTLRNQAGFTLLELLVVVAILAIIAGGVMAAYDGLEEQSAKGDASHSIATIDSAIRAASVINDGDAPNDLDSLIAVTPGSDVLTDPGITGGAPIANLNSSLSDKLTTSVGIETSLPATYEASLAAAGITSLRYIDVSGNSNACVSPTFCLLTTNAQNGTDATVSNIEDADIPNRIFDFPREGTDRNRGRGFSQTLPADAPVAIFEPGRGGINLTKVGANAGDMVGQLDDEYTDPNGSTADVLVAVGLGNNASIYASGQSVGLAQAPTYGDVAKNEYSRYILLYNVGSVDNPKSVATLQAVIDSKGDFLDEELAEFSGQKP